MKSITALVVWSIVIGAAFAFAWRFGWLKRIAQYIADTREELRKCTWPGRDELWGSTVLVMVATGLLGLFTVLVDFFMAWVVRTVV